MKRIIPDITVENCEQALQFYQSVFGGEIKNVRKADGKGMFEGHAGKIMHAELHINDSCVLYLVDPFDREVGGTNVSLVLDLDSEEEINRLYSKLSEGGKIVFELQKTFWGANHALVHDKYGVLWALNHQLR